MQCRQVFDYTNNLYKYANSIVGYKYMIHPKHVSLNPQSNTNCASSPCHPYTTVLTIQPAMALLAARNPSFLRSVNCDVSLPAATVNIITRFLATPRCH